MPGRTQQLGTGEVVSVSADQPFSDSVIGVELAISSEPVGFVPTTQVIKGVLVDMLEGLNLVDVSEGL